MNRLEVKASKVQFVSLILLGLFLVPLALALFGHEMRRGFAIGPFLIVLAVLAGYGAIVWLVRRGHSRSVKYFAEDGLTRNDGLRFSWMDLARVVDQMHTRKGSSQEFLWRTEIQFKNGQSAWLIPRKISNYKEVREYVANLPCEHTEVRV